MEKLSKLNINSEKIMKNDELVSLRGGYDGINCPSGQFECLCDHVSQGCVSTMQECLNKC